jgi:hypothetical protein
MIVPRVVAVIFIVIGNNGPKCKESYGIIKGIGDLLPLLAT